MGSSGLQVLILCCKIYHELSDIEGYTFGVQSVRSLADIAALLINDVS